MSAEEEYKVKDIVDHEIHQGIEKWKVQWDGYNGKPDEFTWEPKEYLEHLEVWIEYEQKRKAKSRSKSKLKSKTIAKKTSTAIPISFSKKKVPSKTNKINQSECRNNEIVTSANNNMKYNQNKNNKNNSSLNKMSKKLPVKYRIKQRNLKRRQIIIKPIKQISGHKRRQNECDINTSTQLRKRKLNEKGDTKSMDKILHGKDKNAVKQETQTAMDIDNNNNNTKNESDEEFETDLAYINNNNDQIGLFPKGMMINQNNDNTKSIVKQKEMATIVTTNSNNNININPISMTIANNNNIEIINRMDSNNNTTDDIQSMANNNNKETINTNTNGSESDRFNNCTPSSDEESDREDKSSMQHIKIQSHSSDVNYNIRNINQQLVTPINNYKQNDIINNNNNQSNKENKDYFNIHPPHSLFHENNTYNNNNNNNFHHYPSNHSPYNNTNNYNSYSNKRCYSCHEMGHISRHCPKNINYGNHDLLNLNYGNFNYNHNKNGHNAPNNNNNNIIIKNIPPPMIKHDLIQLLQSQYNVTVLNCESLIADHKYSALLQCPRMELQNNQQKQHLLQMDIRINTKTLSVVEYDVYNPCNTPKLSVNLISKQSPISTNKTHRKRDIIDVTDTNKKENIHNIETQLLLPSLDSSESMSIMSDSVTSISNIDNNTNNNNIWSFSLCVEEICDTNSVCAGTIIPMINVCIDSTRLNPLYRCDELIWYQQKNTIGTNYCQYVKNMDMTSTDILFKEAVVLKWICGCEEREKKQIESFVNELKSNHPVFIMPKKLDGMLMGIKISAVGEFFDGRKNIEGMILKVPAPKPK